MLAARTSAMGIHSSSRAKCGSCEKEAQKLAVVTCTPLSTFDMIRAVWCFPFFSRFLSPRVSRSFGVDRHAVTNDQFAAFVRDTAYVTEAETFQWSFVLE